MLRPKLKNNDTGLFSCFSKRETDFSLYFLQEDEQVVRNDFCGLLNMANVKYDVTEWRLFINPLKRSLSRRY